MEKFILTGTYLRDQKRNYKLKLPKAKYFELPSVNEGSEDVNLWSIIDGAVRKSSQSFQNQVRHYSPPPHGLHEIFKNHPFPRSQGPVILPFECEGEWENGIKINVRTNKDVMDQRTVFHHDNDQPCGAWYPTVFGIESWKSTYTNNIVNHCYDVQELGNGILGPASLRDMSIVYTCNQLRCVVHCPCNVCNDNRNNCKMQCKTEICQHCNSQCKEHGIKLPRVFDAKVDHCTLITQKMGMLQIGIAHAGIPLSCVSCSNDLLEHQSLHLVFHTRCRFCVHQMRAFTVLHRGVVSIEDYKEAKSILKWSDARTCSYCLSKHQDAFARIKHENYVHEGKERPYICTECDRSFTNKNALDYHVEKHIPGRKKETCEMCGFQSSSKRNLREHEELLHNKASDRITPEFHCSYCGKTYKVTKSLDRHLKEKHWKVNKNLDYIEDMDSIGDIICKHCDKTFKRSYCLERHIKSVHTQEKSYSCSECMKKFTRKDRLGRHMKTLHSS